MENFPADRFRAGFKKLKETIFVTTEIGVSPDMFLIIRRYRIDQMYKTKLLNR